MNGLGDPQVAEQVMAYITDARWFAGKGRLGSLVSLTPLPWLSEVTEFYSPSGPPAVRLVIAEVAYAVEEDRRRTTSADGPEARASCTSSPSPTGRRRTPTCTTPRSPGSTIPISARPSRTTPRGTPTRAGSC